MQTALSSEWGALPYLGCYGPRYNETEAGQNSTDNGHTILDEVWYYQHVFGRPQNGISLPVEATSPVTTCSTSKNAVWYYERTPASVRAVPAAEGPQTNGTSGIGNGCGNPSMNASMSLSW